MCCTVPFLIIICHLGYGVQDNAKDLDSVSSEKMRKRVEKLWYINRGDKSSSVPLTRRIYEVVVKEST